MKKLKQLQFLTIFIILFLGYNVVSAQKFKSKVDKLLRSEFSGDQTGISALIAKKGKIVYRKAYGKADLELDVDMTVDNIFEIASITKQFTAVSVLMLMEEGKLNLEDEITKFIPDYPTKGKKITIHHLLTHTSGIKDYGVMPGFQRIMSLDKTPKEFIDFFKNEPMDFEPGEAYRYSNSGYFILGYIVERLSRMSYREFIEQKIFKKLNMNSSYYGTHRKLIKNRASGYQRSGEYRNAEYISFTLPYAAGSLMSTVDDMLKWQIALTNNTLVKRVTIEKAYTNYTLNNGKKINYGYGWRINELGGVKTVEHDGSIPGYGSSGFYVPDEDVYVILLSNCDCKSLSFIGVEIVGLVTGKSRFKKESAIRLQENKMKEWVGAYEFNNGVIRYFTFNDGKLFSQREGSPQKIQVFPKSPNSFSPNYSFITYNFAIEKGKKTVSFKNRIYESKGASINKEAPKEKKAITLSANILKQYEGKYQVEPGYVITITSKGNRLFGEAPGEPKIELFAESKTKFFLKVMPAIVEFHKNKKGEIEALTFSEGSETMRGKKK